MTVIVTHRHISGQAAGPSATRVYGTHWDEQHVVTGLENVVNVDTTNADNITGGSQTGSGAMVRATSPTLTTPTVNGLLTKHQSSDASGQGTRQYRSNNTTYTETYMSAAGIGIATADALNWYSNSAAAIIASLDRSGNFQALAGIGCGGVGATFNGSTSGSTILKATATASGTLTLPAATDTLIGKATTDTLTNKTFNTAGTGNVFQINGTGITAVTGTGSAVLATSPTLTTPNLGTPSAVVLTNATGTAAGLTAGTVTTNANLTGLVTSSGNATSLALGQLTASLGANVTMNNTANYFDGPSIAQGSTGTWFVSATVTVSDTAASTPSFYAKLWDGTTVIASAITTVPGTANGGTISLSGYITSPAGNLRVSCRDVSATTGLIVANATGNSKDSTISAFRIA